MYEPFKRLYNSLKGVLFRKESKGLDLIVSSPANPKENVDLMLCDHIYFMHVQRVWTAEQIEMMKQYAIDDGGLEEWELKDRKLTIPP